VISSEDGSLDVGINDRRRSTFNSLQVYVNHYNAFFGSLLNPALVNYLISSSVVTIVCLIRMPLTTPTQAFITSPVLSLFCLCTLGFLFIVVGKLARVSILSEQFLEKNKMRMRDVGPGHAADVLFWKARSPFAIKIGSFHIASMGVLLIAIEATVDYTLSLLITVNAI